MASVKAKSAEHCVWMEGEDEKQQTGGATSFFFHSIGTLCVSVRGSHRENSKGKVIIYFETKLKSNRKNIVIADVA